MAVISLGGKQYLVNAGDKFLTNRLDQKEGEVFDVKDMLGGEAVKLRITSHLKGDKIRVLKYKAKKGYKRIYGSRAFLTQVEVVSNQKAELQKKKTTKNE